MKTFTIGSLEIDVLQHRRVDGSRFPRPDPDSIADYFVVNARWNGGQIDFYPNEGKRYDSLTFYWVGKKTVPIYSQTGTRSREIVGPADQESYDADPDGYSGEWVGTGKFEDVPVYSQTGTKRGGDARGRFFRTVVHRLGKAMLAQQLGKTVGQISQDDIDAVTNARLKAALTGDFTPPADLKAYALDDACRYLRDADGDLEEGDPIRGTVANIDIEYDGAVTRFGSKADSGTSLLVDDESDEARAYGRFSLSSLPTGATVDDISIQFNVLTTNVSSGEGVRCISYNSNGDDDPESDDASTAWSNSASGTGLVTDCETTGSKTTDQNGWDSLVEGNIDSPDIFSIGIRESLLDSGDAITIESIENAGSDPFTLIVDYTTGVDASVSGEVATATAAGLAATVTALQSTSIAGAVASATSDSLSATITAVEVISASVSGEVATATAEAPSGAVQVATSISGEAATATAAAAEATITSIGIAAIAGEAATATAAANEATITALTSASISGEVATASAEALEAVLAAQITTSIAGAVAAATAAALLGSVTIYVEPHGIPGNFSVPREITPATTHIASIPREIRPVERIRPIQQR